MHEALFYNQLPFQKVECVLCPWFCKLDVGETGNCRVRTNFDGKLYSEVYGKVAALAIDPIEKKPLYHFHPGKVVLSIGGVGCNLHCKFCQNHRISQCYASDFKSFYEISSENIVQKALEIKENTGIAYTYNEPFTFFEFMMETAAKARQNGLKNVVVSNGYINSEPLKELIPLIDAFNIDLKSFSKSFYSRITKGKLEPVLKSLKAISKSASHLEITHLVIPGLNDNTKEFHEMINWISDELGDSVPLHISRYFPNYEMDNPSTPLNILENFYIAAKKKLRYVYLGNTNNAVKSSTFCRNCNNMLIMRNISSIKVTGIDAQSRCINCNQASGIII
jgi:pyruvate formate lyase activating enzyme